MGIPSSILLEYIQLYIYDCGTWAKLEFERFFPSKLRVFLTEVANYCINLVKCIYAVKAGRDGDNVSAKSDSPPFMQGQLALLRTSIFNRSVLDKYREQLEKQWSAQ